MKINYAIHSSDSNPLYLDFWPYVKKAWLKLGIKPVLVYIAADYDSKIIDESDSIVVRVKPEPDIPLSFQTQWVRFWITSNFYQGVCIISDIDMIPLSHWYFNEQIKDASVHSYIHLNPCIEQYGRLPVCYHVAMGNTFKKVLSLENTWQESLSKVYALNFDSALHNNNPKWGNDEEYTTQQILKYQKDNPYDIWLLKRSTGIVNRIDRGDWKYDKTLLTQANYYDVHCMRPVQDHADEIDFLINHIK
jgi:hypothetical protein